MHREPDPAEVVEHERGEHAHGDDDPQEGRRADGGGGVELGQDQQNTQKTAEPGPPGHLPELLSGGNFELAQREAAREQGGGADEQRQEGRRDRQAERLRQGRVLSRLDRVGETSEDRQSVEEPHGRDSPAARGPVSPVRHRGHRGRGRTRPSGRAERPPRRAAALRASGRPGRGRGGAGVGRAPAPAATGSPGRLFPRPRAEAGGLDKASPSAEGFLRDVRGAGPGGSG